MAEYCFCEAVDGARDRANELREQAEGFCDTAEAADDPCIRDLMEQSAVDLENAAARSETAAGDLRKRCAAGNYGPGDPKCLGCYVLGSMNRPEKRHTIARLDGNA